VDWKKIVYDAVIVGSGATGRVATKWLAERGAKVLVLEAGPELSSELRGERIKSEEEFASTKRRQPVQSRSLLYRRNNCHLFTDDLDNPYTTDSTTEFNWIRSRQSGGRTLIWSRFALRMSEQELDLRSPHGCWPITYKDLAPYYAKMEALIGVSGTREGISALPDGCFLPRSVPPYMRRLREALSRRFPERHLIPSREATKEIPLVFSSGNESATAHSNPTLRTNCIAARIELDRPDHARRVLFIDRESKRWHDVEGRVILLCSSTIESIRLLLASTSSSFPTGLANGSGMLGHCLMDHFGGPRIVAVGKIPGAEPLCRERAYIPQFCNLGDENSLGGYGIQADFETDRRGNSIMTMGVFGEVLPCEDNRVELDHSVHDSWGLAVPKIRFRYRENERNMALHAQSALQEITEALELRPMISHEGFLAGGTRAHELGGARMGNQASHSVLNPFNQSWDVPNLFITDGSSFPSSGYKGPTLTMMALTARACDRIVGLLHRGAV
jgi:choline dehydrogenase-like flavoprotein